MDYKEFEKKYKVDRRNTNAVKWDALKDNKTLPMWIADMEFKTCEAITENLHKRLDCGTYGYSTLPEDFYDVMIDWNRRKAGFELKKEWIMHTNGSVDALCQCIEALTEKGDAILINSPVYPPFHSKITDGDRKLVDAPLMLQDGYFTFNYKEIEKKIVKYNVKMMVICNPHNPIGRVWKKGELEALLEITHQYGVILVSDEVHGDVIMPGQEFCSCLSLSKYRNDIIVINAVSKAFNIAVFSFSNLFVPNRKFRDRLAKVRLSVNPYHPDCAFSALPSYYGYKYGEEWLEQVIEVIYENYLYFKKRLEPYFEILPLEGTYLQFVDLSQYCGENKGGEWLLNKCGIMANDGTGFGKGYEKWVRINLAAPRSHIKKCCDSIINAIKKEELD